MNQYSLGCDVPDIARNLSMAAFPQFCNLGNGTANGTAVWGYGLSKRELFAAMAMQGMLSDSASIRASHDVAVAKFTESRTPRAVTAELAVRYADALIDELAKEPTK